MRAISTAIAGLIVFTFIVLALIPLLINIYSSSVQSHMLLSAEINKKLRGEEPLNITYLGTSTSGCREYIISNKGTTTTPLSLLVLSNGTTTFLVKPGAAYNKTYNVSSTLSVEIVPLEGASLANSTIILSPPSGSVKLVVCNGYLAAIASSGSIERNIEAQTLATNETQVYTTVAKTVQANYITLANTSTLEDLVNSSQVIITTNPANITSSSTNKSILDQGLMESYCFTGAADSPEITPGGFQPPSPQVNYTRLNALLIQNIGPWIGSMIIGGTGGDYNKDPIGLSLYIPTYLLAAYNPDKPGIITYNYEYNGANYTGICIDWVIDPSQGTIFSDCYSPLYEPLSLQLAGHLLNTSAGQVSSGSEDLSSLTMNYTYIPSLGAILLGQDTVIYCADAQLINNSGYLYIDVNRDHCIVYHESSSNMVEKSTTIQSIVIHPLTIEFTNTSETYIAKGEAQVTDLSYDYIAYELNPISISSIHVPSYPIVLKITDMKTNKSFIKLYDGLSKALRKGVDAFGIYYYSGYSFNGISAYYYIDTLYAENGYLNLFTFHEDETSGLRPFTVIADTDGNGLPELVFTDEWFKPGPKIKEDVSDLFSIGASNTIDLYDLSDVYIALKANKNVTGLLTIFISANNETKYVYPSIYYPLMGNVTFTYARGCIDIMRIPFLYFVFKNPINGEDIAGVLVNIRYSFHDGVSSADEISNTSTSIWGVLIVDENGSVVNSNDFIYNELAALKNAWPPSTNYASASVFLPLPNTSDTFYLAFGFIDSCKYVESMVKEITDLKVDSLYTADIYGEWYTMDLDYTLRIEVLSIIYLHR